MRDGNVGTSVGRVCDYLILGPLNPRETFKPLSNPYKTHMVRETVLQVADL